MEVITTYTLPGPNLAPSETWSTGHRTPYGWHLLRTAVCGKSNMGHTVETN